MTAPLKVLIYYTHKESLGHSSRITTLANAFVRFPGRRFKVYLLQAGVPQSSIQGDRNIEKIDVPFPFYSRAQFKKIPVDTRHIGLRAEFILDKIRDIRPDVFITEYFPFGRKECFLELAESLVFLKNEGKLIFASIGYPYLTQDVMANTENFLRFVRLYKKIFIHTPADFEYPFFLSALPGADDRRRYASVIESIYSKIVHTGYILPDYHEGALEPRTDALVKQWRRSRKTRILVSRGGGTTCPKLIACSILAKKYLGPEYAFLVSCGPASGNKEMEFYRGLVRKHRIKDIHVVTYAPQFMECLRASDLSVNLAGYNTSVQLLWLGTKCLVVPYTVLARSGWINDQTPRSRLLEKYLKARLFDYDELRSEKLAQGIEAMTMAAAPRPLARRHFHGAVNTVKTVLKFL